MLEAKLQGIRYVPYEELHFEPLRELFGIVWGEKRAVAYDHKHWNRSLLGISPGVVGILDDRIVGFYMVWPMLLSDGRGSVMGGQPIDSMVHPSLQGKGMLRELANRCYELCNAKKIEVMFGAPNRAAYAGNVGALNWCHAGDIWEMLRPIFARGRDTRWASQGRGWVCDTADTNLAGAIAVKDWDTSLHALLDEKEPRRRTWRINRSAEWMAYRYGSAMDAEYYTVHLQASQRPLGGAVCGLRKTTHGVKATLADFFVEDEVNTKLALNAAAMWAAHKGARYIISKTTNRAMVTRLLRHGFIPFRRTPLISRTLGWRCHAANPFSPTGWSLFGGAFDTL